MGTTQPLQRLSAMVSPSCIRHLRLRPDAADKDLVVNDLCGNPRGHIVAIVLDLVDARPVFALVGEGGLLGDHRAVPWSVFQRRETPGFLLPVDDDAWRLSPSHPPEAVIDWDDDAVHRRIHDYYDQRAATATDAEPAMDVGCTAVGGA